MHEPIACTIVANNYLAYARVLARSFAAQHPQGRFFVLIVDRPDPGLDYSREPFTVVFAEDLGIPHFAHLAFRYSILELSTAVKPAFLQHLHDAHGAAAACYFDPDILITGDLGDLYEAVYASDVVLTPHITRPIDDALTPAERDFLLSGIYNLGFCGFTFNVRTKAFLAWWHARLYRECLHAVERGLFVDQKWMDFAPAFLPGARILREPGYNAAYWNAMHRRLERAGDGWLVDGQPLRFFHFSGLIHDRPEIISRFQNRLTFDDRPDLDALFTDYRHRLDEAGHDALRRRPYAYGCFDDGTRVPKVARRVLQLTDPEARRWPEPFAAAGPDSFLAWLSTGGATEALPISRAALAVWDQRPDLQVVFPAPETRDRTRFAEWILVHREECEFDAVFWHPIEAARRRLQPAATSAETGAGHRRAWDALARGARAGTRLGADEIATLTAEAGTAGDPASPRIPRISLMIHRQRGDLQAAYPDPLRASRDGFAWWFATSGRAEYDLPAALVRPVLRTLPPRQRVRATLWWSRHQIRQYRRQDPPVSLTADGGLRAPDEAVETVTVHAPSGPSDRTRGLNVVGWATAPTGVGEACRGTLSAITSAGIPHVVWNLAARLDGRAMDEIDPPGQPYDITLYHVNADMTPHVIGALPRWIVSGRHRIGMWFWELAHLPLSQAAAFRCLDEVWAPTKFCYDAFQALAPIDVRWVPPAVVPPIVQAGGMGRDELGVPPDAFLLLNAFDALSVPERKNPLGLIDAFGRACRQSDRRLHLLLKVSHADSHPTLMAELTRAAADLPVTMVARHLSRRDVNGLLSAADAYLALHRSEGLGLPLIEAMYLGKPVIATGYGGVTDFLNDETGWVVRYGMTELEQAHGPYPQGAVWAAPDADHAASLICRVASEPEEVARRVTRATDTVRELYLPEAFAHRLERELARIHDGP